MKRANDPPKLFADWRMAVLERENHPLNLAVFRVVLFGFLFFWVDLEQVGFYASLPQELLFPPFGSGWLLELVPPDPATATAAGVVLLAASAAACVGFRTRISTWIAVIVGFYVLLIPQSYGKVNHYHHLLWFGALLATSPCGEALSVDRWRRKGDLGLQSPYCARFQNVFVLVWLLMGLIYFFPGIYKFWVGGWSFDWALSDNLRYFMWREWLYSAVPLSVFRIDHVPWLYRSAGIGVMIFEVGFVFLVLWSPTHRLAAVAGVAFHVLTGLFLGIWFVPLLVTYVSFVDWRQLISRWVEPAVIDGPLRGGGDGSVSSTALVGAILVLGASVTGRYAVDRGWPFAVYPPFAEIRKDENVETLLVESADLAGTADAAEQRRVDDARARLKKEFGSVRFEMLLQRILEEEGAARERRLRGLARLFARETSLGEEDRLRILRARVSTRPSHRGRVVTPPILLAEVRVPAAD